MVRLLMLLLAGLCLCQCGDSNDAPLQAQPDGLLFAPQIRVLSPRRTPVVGATVSWHRFSLSAGEAPHEIAQHTPHCGPMPLSSDEPVFSARSNSSGKALGPHLPAGTYLVSTQVGKLSGHVVLCLRDEQGGVHESTAGDGLPLPVDLYLRPFFDITAEVVSSSGAPVEGAVVAMANPDSESHHYKCQDGRRQARIVHGLTNREGQLTWRITSCAPNYFDADRLHIHVLCNGREATTAEHLVSGDHALVRLTSPETMTIDFRVLASDENGTLRRFDRNAMLSWGGDLSARWGGTRIFDPNSSRIRGCTYSSPTNWSVVIPPEGQVLSCFTHGAVPRLRLSADGNAASVEVGGLRDQAKFDLELGEPMAKLQFRAQYGDGLAISATEVIHLLRLNGTSVARNRFEQSKGVITVYVEPNTYGQIRFDTSHLCPHEEVPSAEYLPIKAGASHDLGLIELPMAIAVVRGRVLDQWGQPVSGAAVKAWRREKGVAAGPELSGTTGPNGHYTLRNPSRLLGPFLVRAQHHDLISELVPTDGSEPLIMKLRAAGSARADLQLAPGFRSVLSLRLRSEGVRGSFPVECNDSGILYTGPMPPGNYRLRASFGNGTQAESDEFTIQWGKVTTADLSEITRVLANFESAEVKVLRSDGRPLVGARVKVFGTGFGDESDAFGDLHYGDHKGRVRFIRSLSAYPILHVGPPVAQWPLPFAESLVASAHFPLTLTLRDTHRLSINFSESFPIGVKEYRWLLRLQTSKPWPPALVQVTGESQRLIDYVNNPSGYVWKSKVGQFSHEVPEGHYTLKAFFGRRWPKQSEEEVVTLGSIEVDGSSKVIEFTVTPSMLKALDASLD